MATPIGNLEDITLRALSTLKRVALIAAEDTRRTSILLRHFGINTPTTSLHEHNEHVKLPRLLSALAAGSEVALVSDAGTPLVADPGQRLIAAAIEQGVAVVPIPGPSAVLAALSAFGLPADAFVFAGFVPAKSNDRNKWLSAFESEERTIVFFEAPHRIRKTLEAISTLLVDRPIIISRELTKIHEEVVRTTTNALAQLKITKSGDGLYRNASNSTPVDANDVQVRQGMLEGSNVNPIIEITNLIEIQRAYESVTRMIENTNDLSRRAVERLGRAA